MNDFNVIRVNPSNMLTFNEVPPLENTLILVSTPNKCDCLNDCLFTECNPNNYFLGVYSNTGHHTYPHQLNVNGKELESFSDSATWSYFK